MTLMIDLEPALEAKLASIAAQRGLDLPKLVVETLENLEPPQTPTRREGEGTGDYLIRLVEEVRASIPDVDWMAAPSDHARNYKHYLYGAPKEP